MMELVTAKRARRDDERLDTRNARLPVIAQARGLQKMHRRVDGSPTDGRSRRPSVAV